LREAGGMSDDPEVVNDEAAARFEIAVDGQLADLSYRRRGNRLVLVHTGVPDALEGRGIGGKLVTAAIDYAVQHGLTVVPLCPFARGWLERHPDVASRATIDWKTPPS
jgi:predicted GNAT family acetyltransferase